jgi:hypothetical protein
VQHLRYNNFQARNFPWPWQDYPVLSNSLCPWQRRFFSLQIAGKTFCRIFQIVPSLFIWGSVQVNSLILKVRVWSLHNQASSNGIDKWRMLHALELLKTKKKWWSIFNLWLCNSLVKKLETPPECMILDGDITLKPQYSPTKFFNKSFGSQKMFWERVDKKLYFSWHL